MAPRSCFERGGEEAEALAEAGIAFEVVPGVSAGVAVPAYAGIPPTHRDVTAEVVFLTGHDSATSPSPVDWACYATSPATLAVFMGLANLGAIARLLLDLLPASGGGRCGGRGQDRAPSAGGEGRRRRPARRLDYEPDLALSLRGRCRRHQRCW